jgi:hypothetical protein
MELIHARACSSGPARTVVRSDERGNGRYSTTRYDLTTRAGDRRACGVHKLGPGVHLPDLQADDFTNPTPASGDTPPTRKPLWGFLAAETRLEPMIVCLANSPRIQEELLDRLSAGAGLAEAAVASGMWAAG